MEYIGGSIIRKGLPRKLHDRAARCCSRIIDQMPSWLACEADALLRLSERLAIAQIKFEDAIERIEQRMYD